MLLRKLQSEAIIICGLISFTLYGDLIHCYYRNIDYSCFKDLFIAAKVSLWHNMYGFPHVDHYRTIMIKDIQCLYLMKI